MNENRQTPFTLCDVKRLADPLGNFSGMVRTLGLEGATAATQDFKRRYFADKL
jgi:hypothetical protein